jgi:hypothetical protein
MVLPNVADSVFRAFYSRRTFSMMCALVTAFVRPQGRSPEAGTPAFIGLRQTPQTPLLE